MENLEKYAVTELQKEIAVLLSQGLKQIEIAGKLKTDPAVVSRSIKAMKKRAGVTFVETDWGSVLKTATPRQAEFIELKMQGKTNVSIADELKLDRRTVGQVLNAAVATSARKNRLDHLHQVPEGYQIKGTSTYYRDDGSVRGQWVRTNQDLERKHELMKEAVQALCEDIKPLPPSIITPKEVDPNLMAVYPLGDPHIGMRSWAEETGQDWDLYIAEEAFLKTFDRLVKTAPHCEECTIVNLGDFFHTDNLQGVTSRSGHNLDVDGRYAKMVRVGIKIIRQVIESALQHHKHVRVINAVGNHDDVSSLFLSISLANIYENDPRVTVDMSPAPFHYVEWGRVMFGVHHGHSCKIDKLPGVMAADQAQAWGRTMFRYWLTGHIHHDSLKEFPGCKVESFRTLAASDAYAAWAGYRSLQDSKCLVIHKDFGEIERHTVNLQMVDRIGGGGALIHE